MPLKRTKSELKVQRESLKRFQRYLPTLQLKKQQLQAEVRRVEQAQRDLALNREKLRKDLDDWVALFGEEQPFEEWLSLKKLELGTQHIAGVDVPTLKQFEVAEDVPDRFARPAWIDEGMRALKADLEMGVQLEILRRQQGLIEAELRTTSQRVNLFEKVKIPECKENIRIIRIALGDEQVAAVARGKLAKKKGEAAA